MASKNYIGQRVGKLVIQELYRERRSAGDGWRYMARFVCDCGGSRVVERGNIAHKSFIGECAECSGRRGGKLAHGNSIARKQADPIGYKCYYTWQAMKRRCYNPSERRYKNYGGRGISVCERWLHSYENFRDDMGLPPSMAHQIDRINNDGNYDPSNCRWVSATDNANNKSSSKMISAFGRTQTVAQWAAEYGIPYHTLKRRLAAGCNAELALSTGNETLSRVIYITELGQFSSLRECAAAHGMSMSGVHNRFKSGKYPTWTIKENQP